MVNYANGKIYKIRSPQTDKVYIGSTVQDLKNRLDGHKSHYKSYLKGSSKYISSSELLKYNDAFIELIEVYPCNNKEELYDREQYYIDITPNIVNINNVIDKKNMKRINYKNSKIYKIISKNTENIYIGSTACINLETRLNGHKVGYKAYLNKKGPYITSFEILKYNEYEILLIENYPCNSLDELKKKEGYWVRNTLKCVNKNIPGRTKKEYSEECKEKIKVIKQNYIKKNPTRQKQYYEKNKEYINKNAKLYRKANSDNVLMNKKQYYKKNKEVIIEKARQFRRNHKDKISSDKNKYYEKNKEHINKRMKQYRNDNKEKVSMNKKQYYEHIKHIDVECECGIIVKKSVINHHKKTKKHKKLMQFKQINSMLDSINQFDNEMIVINRQFDRIMNDYNELISQILHCSHTR